MKEIQRTSKEGNLAWHLLCNQQAGGEHNPAAHNDQFLRPFLQQWHPAYRGLAHVPKTPSSAVWPREDVKGKDGRKGGGKKGGGRPHRWRLQSQQSRQSHQPLPAGEVPSRPSPQRSQRVARRGGGPPATPALPAPPPHPGQARRVGGPSQSDPPQRAWAMAATLADAAVSPIWRAPPRDLPSLAAYLDKQERKLALLEDQDDTSTTFHGAYADIAVRKRMLLEGRRLRDKLLRKSRRKKVREARSQLTLASKRMVELEPTIGNAQRILSEARAAYATAQRTAEDAREVLDAVQRERIPEGRTRRRSSASWSDSSSSLESPVGPPRSTVR